ncbi:TonB-dependent receptor [Aliiglaciecola sp. 3_MG-2023]|uniref:TonB-dependent receptor n=1 Tax=Aliiglaciecola sp. 3_MG-2023 TaxID=3062644 RepID=UPI0026E3DB26|nr:TonB-dependent receptor [Aliiglaciecola sp. 3_MG-2023]MDO6694618.1 TonB-dependent receptor [Aliiglaciecola sp. 3_MG-2023]
MYKISRIVALVSALIPASLMAQSIEGVVKNSEGNAVKGALITVEGTSAKTLTNSDGRFVFNDLKAGLNELHISASGFAHLYQDIVLTEDGVEALALTLIRSPIEVIDIVGTPIHMSVMESASPVSVLSGETLRRQQASTLGDTLEKLPGVQSNFHGNVASTPIIRGLSGPRVLIAQNGLDVSDVSRVGPDHSVATEASTSQQIEVLRGPATLFYGSGAIGGVVNVVDGRVPTDNTTRGEWLLETNSADEKKLASFNVTTGYESFGFYADGFWHESEDYEVPVEAEVEEEEHDHEEEESHDYVVENSSEKSNGFTLGASYLFDAGYVGVAVEQFNREYGIPGHSHDGDVNVYADLEQTRIQLLSEINIQSEWINQVNVRGAYTDYEHSEIENDAVGTLFENDTHEIKVDVLHNPLSDWNGGFSLHFKNSDISAVGEEAFTPPSKSETIALALMEEKHFGDVLLQFGARIERVTIDADDVLLPVLEAHEHEEEEEDEHDHDHGDEETATRVFDVAHKFTPVSLSAGLVWDFTPGYNIGLSVSRSERAPSAAELLSFGAHIGTNSYEVGALFALDGEEIGLSGETIDLETANNIDLTLRKTQGDVAFVFNAFYNQVDNYYYQTNTGLFVESSHDHDDEHDHDHDHDAEEEEHTDELPVYIFETDDVVLNGFEVQVAWQATDTIKATVFSDFVRARLKDGGNLPRTSPLRFGTQFAYVDDSLTAHLDVTRYQSQDHVATDETSTAGYTMVDASVSYDLPVSNQDIMVYLKGTNLTDTEARVHTSFIKDIAPRPGRSFAVGIRGNF